MSRNRAPKNHYSPVFSNQPWADETNHYLCWKRRYDLGFIQKEREGRKNWGWERKLWSEETEQLLGRELENPVAHVYEKLLNLGEPEEEERLKWAQFLRSQAVRTPTFMRYESLALQAAGVTEMPAKDKVGCECCLDLAEVTGRRWLVIEAHPEDYFIRTDNPVFQTSFLWDPAAVLYYPLSPRRCFVAAAMPAGWNAQDEADAPRPTFYLELDKGIAHMLNFYLSRSADESIIMHPSDASSISQAMFSETVGAYPQPPFDLHRTGLDELEAARTSLRYIMSKADGLQYPDFAAPEVLTWEHLAEVRGPA